MSTETVGLLGSGTQDVHLNFHTAPELCTTTKANRNTTTKANRNLKQISKTQEEWSVDRVKFSLWEKNKQTKTQKKTSSL